MKNEFKIMIIMAIVSFISIVFMLFMVNRVNDKYCSHLEKGSSDWLICVQ